MASGSKKKNKTVKIRTKGEYHAPVRLRRTKAIVPTNTADDPTNHAHVVKELIPTHKSENPSNETEISHGMVWWQTR